MCICGIGIIGWNGSDEGGTCCGTSGSPKAILIGACVNREEKRENRFFQPKRAGKKSLSPVVYP